MKKSAHLIEYFRMGGHVSVLKWCKLKIILALDRKRKYVEILSYSRYYQSGNFFISRKQGSIIQHKNNY